MAKKNRKVSKRLPMVSVCTPTYNRRPFIPSMLKCFEHQTYPKERIEWIIIDDGTDKIDDLVKNLNILQNKITNDPERLQDLLSELKVFKESNY